MKRILCYIIPLVSLIVTSCNKNEVTEKTFDVRVEVAHSSSVMYRVFPQYNDFYYSSGAISVAEYNGKTEQEVIDSLNRYLNQMYDTTKQIFARYNLPEPTFQEAMLWQCANIISAENLTPETPYYIWNLRFDSKLNPAKKLHLTPTKTTPYVHSDITFDLTSNRSEIYITPSNNDPYLWDYISMKDARERYLGIPELYYYELVAGLELYQIIDPLLSVGKDTDNVADYYTLAENDTIYVMAAAYQKETSSDITIFELVYWQGQFSIRKLLNTSFDPLATRLSTGQNQVLPRRKRELSRRVHRGGGTIQ